MMRRPPARLATPFALALVLVVTACHGSADARQAGQLRYNGRTLEEWWQLRRHPDRQTATEATVAMRRMGAAAVPFLAAKAADNDLGDVIGGSTTLERMCASALPAMQEARSRYPSVALDQAIRRVQAGASDPAQVRRCATDADSARAH